MQEILPKPKKKNIYIVRVFENRNRFPEEVVQSPFLKIFKTPVANPALSREIQQDDLQRCLPISTIL